MDPVELRQERATKIEAARGLLNLAESEERDLSQGETESYESLIGEAELLAKQIERESRQLKLEADLAVPVSTPPKATPSVLDLSPADQRS